MIQKMEKHEIIVEHIITKHKSKTWKRDDETLAHKTETVMEKHKPKCFQQYFGHISLRCAILFFLFLYFLTVDISING